MILKKIITESLELNENKSFKRMDINKHSSIHNVGDDDVEILVKVKNMDSVTLIYKDIDLNKNKIKKLVK